jgi:hypothetical protein
MAEEIDSRRVNTLLPAPLYQRLYDEARIGHVSVPELIRDILLNWKTSVPKGTWYQDAQKYE